MHRSSLAPTLLLSGLLLAGCASSIPTVATIGDERITVRDFEDSYAKNNGGWDAGVRATREERERFFDLLLKFRLKVKEAKSRGLLQDPVIQEELDGYEQSVAQSYMIEKELVEPNVRMLYDRKKEEVRASHVLIRVAEDAPPADTLKAWETATEVIRRVTTTSFDTLALFYSGDQSVTFNKGDLGYFSSGRMVPEFEDACYALKAGEYTRTPVRTQFGYHVIKVTDRQPSKGPVRVSFILMYFHAPDDTTAVLDTAWSLYRQLQAGADFATLAREYSQEPNSASRGGDVGYYDRDRLPPDIGNVLYSLAKDSVSTPFRVQNGVYVFKVTDFRGIPPFSEAEREMKQAYQQTRYQRDYDRYVHRLKSLYSFSYDVSVLHALERAFPDTNRTPADTLWDEFEDQSFGREPLIRYAGRTMTVGDVLERIAATDEFRSFRLSPANVVHMMERLSDMLVVEEHARRAAERHPAFSRLMEEYRDGILLYRVEQDEVWEKVTVNDSLLRAFHDTRRDQYRWPDRVNFAEIYVTSDSLVRVAERRIAAGEEFLAVAEDMTMRAGYREKKGVWGLQTTTFNDLATRASTMNVGDVSEPIRHGAGWSIVTLLAKEPAREKTFEEAGPELTSAYQEAAAKDREAEWIGELRKKYAVTVSPDELAGAFTGERRDTP